MEEKGFKRDQTSYYVFMCTKCKQYSYVKTNQKTKKCLGCRKLHQVKNLASVSEVIKGITPAKDRVIELQEGLARKDFGFVPVLQADNDFSLAISKSKKELKLEDIKIKNNENDISKFKNVLEMLHCQYKRFPRYLIELAALDQNIPKKEIKFLISEFMNRNLLQKTNEGMYFLVLI